MNAAALRYMFELCFGMSWKMQHERKLFSIDEKVIKLTDVNGFSRPSLRNILENSWLGHHLIKTFGERLLEMEAET